MVNHYSFLDFVGTTLEFMKTYKRNYFILLLLKFSLQLGISEYFTIPSDGVWGIILDKINEIGVDILLLVVV